MLQISNYIRSSYLPSGIYHDSNDKQERAYTNCKFHDPRVGVLVLGRVHVSHNENAFFKDKNLLRNS